MPINTDEIKRLVDHVKQKLSSVRNLKVGAAINFVLNNNPQFKTNRDEVRSLILKKMKEGEPEQLTLSFKEKEPVTKWYDH